MVENPNEEKELELNEEEVAEVTYEEHAGKEEDVEAVMEVEEVEEVEKILELANAVTTTAHDDYDWTRGKKDQYKYSKEEKEAFMKSYDSTLSAMEEFEIVRGIVAQINDGDVVLDLNYKSDGLVALSEFRDMQNIKIGDSVEVYIEAQEDKKGQLVLSRRKAKLLRAWENIKASFEQGKIITGQVLSKTKGGLIVDVGGLETFLPGSQIDIKPVIDYDSYVGKTMEFKVVKINEQIKNAVVSHKALIESDLETQRQEIISSLEKGQVLEGTVKNITDFGAFLDLGGVDGLLYITDISWGRISHPSEALSLNQKLSVVVLDFDDAKKRISLGLKQLNPHPWEVLAKDISEGSILSGKIVNIEDYGAFLEVTPGVEGLIHVSEVSWSNQPINAREFFKLGEKYEAKVVTLDRDGHKMSLSIKQLSDDPWSHIEESYPLNSRHTGEVKNLTPYGIFVELAPGIGGMVHISDLSWTKRFNHPADFVKVGEKLDVAILEIDKDNRKLSLGHKQLEENPWDTFEKVFPVGSYHECTVNRRDDRGAMVMLPYGLEAFAPIRHIKKADGNLAEAEDKLVFKVLEFNRDDKRIVVSHTRYWEDLKKEEEDKQKKDALAAKDAARVEVKKQQDKIEKSTFGELEGFDELKKQLKADEDDAQ